MKIKREWAMPNKNTFSIQPITNWIQSNITDGKWIDPFARISPFKNQMITNDLNEKFKTDYNIDAVEFLKMFSDSEIDGALFDPPYSPRQLKECYQNIGESLHDTKSSVWSSWKNELSRIITIGGLCISFGWNTVGLGKNRGFEIQEILLVCHGGMHNDTICMIEKKVFEQIKLF
jgi:hypothetical protein